MLSFFNYSSFRVSTILILKLTAPALKWLLTLCTHISRSQVAIKSVLTMKIQNAQKLTIFEKMQKQSCIGFFQTPHSCLLLLLRMIKKFNYQTFYVNSNFSLWLENFENRVSNIPRSKFTSERRLFLCLGKKMGKDFRTSSRDLKTSDLK